MKRIAYAVVGLGILGGVLYLGSRLWAQAPPPAPASTQPAPLRTRIGVVNFLHVIKEYKKAQAFQDSITRQTQDFDKTMEPTRTRLIQMRNELTQKPDLDPTKRDQITRDMKRLQGEYQEKAEDFQKTVIKQGDDGLVALYKEVQEAVGLLAKSNDIELVVQFSDPTTAADFYSAGNVKRKIQGGALMPLYVAPGMDISHIVVRMLNDRYLASMAPTPSSTAPRN